MQNLPLTFVLIDNGSLKPSAIKTFIPSVKFFIFVSFYVWLLLITNFFGSFDPSDVGPIFPLLLYSPHVTSGSPFGKSFKLSFIDESISFGI